MKEFYTFSEYFTRKDLPHLKHIITKAAKAANKDQRKLYARAQRHTNKKRV